MEEALSNLVNCIESSINSIKNQLITTQASILSNADKKQQQAWKYRCIGPLIHSLKPVLRAGITASKNLSENSMVYSNQLERVLEGLSETLKQEEIELAESLHFSEEVIFPEDTNNQAMIVTESGPGGLSSGMWTDGESMYKGEFKDLVKHGYGVQIFKDGSIYKGEWTDGTPGIGHWKLRDKSDFFGRRGFGREEEGQEWMVGLKEEDILSKKTNQALDVEVKTQAFNYLYYQGKKTFLQDLDLQQKIDVTALIHDQSVGEHHPTSIKWTNGVE